MISWYRIDMYYEHGSYIIWTDGYSIIIIGLNNN